MTAAAVPTDTIEVRDPSTGDVIGTIPAGDTATVDAAVTAARAAWPAWARTPPAERGERLKAVARMLPAARVELAELQSRDCGKPCGDSCGGVDAGIGAIEQYAELGPLHRGHSLQGSPFAHDAMIREPRGVVAILVPWNAPVAVAAGQLAAALAAGNAVVFKPSERTPLCSARLAELFRVELPDGVLEVVAGDARAGRPLVAHPGVDVVLHTGSVTTGREIARVCGERGAKALLELGGKDPLVVDADVDPVWAAQQAAAGAFANAGQLCTSVERIYVHAAIAAPFVAALADAARTYEIGPLIDRRQRSAVHGHVAAAVEQGARALVGGDIPEGPGCFYPPTVLVDVTDDMAVMRDETFGPVAPVRIVASFDEALALASATEIYGLAASVLTASQIHAARACRELRAGTVKVNAVFGGAPGGAAQPQRLSGTGFGYGPELLDELTFTKVVHVSAAGA